jgi:hypothetical protein
MLIKAASEPFCLHAPQASVRVLSAENFLRPMF